MKRLGKRRGILPALALCTCTWSAAAEGGSPLTLDWSAPAECPTREHVIERVTSILGHSEKPRPELTVRARVERTPGGQWRVDLATDQERGGANRDFEAESCDAAADATALIVGLMIDPTALASADDEGATPGAKTPEAPPVPQAEAPPRPQSFERPQPSAPARPFSFALRASLGGDVGTFSTADFGAELSLAVAPGRMRFELAGSHWVTRTSTLAGTPSEGARIDLSTVGVRAAYVLSSRDVAVAPLVGVEGDWMSATGFGGSAQHQRTAGWAEVAAGATGFWFPFRARHAFALALTLEALAATEKPPRFVAAEAAGPDRTVHQPSPIASRMFLGVESRLF